jgi:hypothetical protein
VRRKVEISNTYYIILHYIILYYIMLYYSDKLLGALHISGTCGGGGVVAHAKEEPDDGGGACADVRAHLQNIDII